MVGLLVVIFIVIAVSEIFANRISEIHWADNFLNERNLTIRDTVFCVEVFVRPYPIPLLGWNERVNLAVCVLRWLMQKDQEAD